MIKAIIFDFFGVLCSEEYWKSVQERFDNDAFHKLATGIHTGRLGWGEFVQKVAMQTEQTTDEVQRMYETQRINLELAAYIDKLHEEYKTALLTNSNATFINPLLKKTGLDKAFDEVVVSSDIGIVKPDPRIYEYALEKLGVKAGEAVFIDDSPARVAGAKAASMKAICYKDFKQMKIELQKLLSGSTND